MTDATFRALYVPEDFDSKDCGWCELAQAMTEWLHAYRGLPVLLETIIPSLRIREGEGFDALESVRARLQRGVMDMESILERHHAQIGQLGDTAVCPYDHQMVS